MNDQPAIHVECIDCGKNTAFDPSSSVCPYCGSQWREARYDYACLAETFRSNVQKRPFDLWRYSDLLPIRNPNQDLRLGEGGTPLIRAVSLGLMLGCHNIFIKDERQGPTASFKDRQAAVTIASLKEAGISEFVIASTGNVAIAYSAYAARASIRLWAFLTSLVPASKMREVALYGTQVIKITGSYDQAKQVAAQFANQKGIPIDLGARSVACIESMKTIAFEICEQLGFHIAGKFDNQVDSPMPWRAPDWYIQAVSGGMGPLGVLKGFSELKKMGLIDRVPKIASIQVEGCAPMVHAWKQGRETALPIQNPCTLISTLATGDPGRTYSVLRQKMSQANGGLFESVSDEEAYRAMHFVAKMEGLSVEPAAAVAFAGLVKLIRGGVIQSDEIVVVNCTGHTMPPEKSILGDEWSRDIVYPSVSGSTEGSEQVAQEEGLLAALSRVAIDRFPRIAIVDDNPDVRRLIRRILQSQGEYSIYEAADGRDAISLIAKEHIDLLILDLMMPEIDGFGVLELLQNNPATANIPVIVVTAKDLSQNEKDRLKGHIQTLLTKGDFLSDELADEVRALLR